MPIFSLTTILKPIKLRKKFCRHGLIYGSVTQLVNKFFGFIPVPIIPFFGETLILRLKVILSAGLGITFLIHFLLSVFALSYNI